MMNWLPNASLASIPLLAFQGIAPPQDGGIPLGRPAVLPPGIEADEESRESSGDRKQRLMDAGIVPTPEPPIIEKGKIEKDVAKILDGGKSGDKLKVANLRMELDFGSWYSIEPPEGVAYVPDFSHGLSALFLLNGEEIGEGKWAGATFAGAQAVFLNGTGYQDAKGRWGGTGPVFFETAISEYGLAGASFSEMKIGDNQSWGFQLRGSYLPFRFVQAKNYFGSGVGKTGEANSHFRLNYFGLGGEAGLFWTYGRLAEAGFFVGINASTPFQMRGRYGFRFALLDR